MYLYLLTVNLTIVYEDFMWIYNSKEFDIMIINDI